MNKTTMGIKMYMLKMAKEKRKEEKKKKNSRTKAVTHSGVRVASSNHSEPP